QSKAPRADPEESAAVAVPPTPISQERIKRLRQRRKSGIAAVIVGGVFATVGVPLLAWMGACLPGADRDHGMGCLLVFGPPGGILTIAAIPLLAGGGWAITSSSRELRTAEGQ